MLIKSALKTLLQKYNLKPNKLLGQNFLIDRNALAEIIAAAELAKDDTVLEVGPGLGVLTRELAKYAGRVIAVEKDKQLAEVLRNILREEKVGNVEVIEGDILKIFTPDCHPGESQDPDPNLKSGCRVKPGMTNNILLLNKYKVVANIPYYLTSHLIRTFLESANPPSLMVLMLQKEVAQRICAKPPKMSLLAVATQFYADTKIIAPVPKEAFWPSPKVDSAIIKITPYSSPSQNIPSSSPLSQNTLFNSPLLQRGGRGDLKSSARNEKIHPNPPHNCGAGSLRKEGINEFLARDDNALFFKVIKAGFSQPRKQLAGNLNKILKIERGEIEKILNDLGFKNTARAQELAVEDWIKLTDCLKVKIREN